MAEGVRRRVGFASAEAFGEVPAEVRATAEAGDVPVCLLDLSTDNVGQLVWEAAIGLSEKKGGTPDDHLADAQAALYAAGIEPRGELT